MNTFIQTFFAPRRSMAKGYHFVALFGAFAVGAFSFIALHGGFVPPITVAHAAGGSTISGVIEESVSDLAPHAGETIVYTFNVEALGGTVATPTDVTIATDTLPSELTFVSSTGTDFGTHSGAWSGVSATFSVTATVNTNATGTILYIPPNIEYADGNCNVTSLAFSVGGEAASSSMETGTGTDCDVTSLAGSGEVPQIAVAPPSADLLIAKTVTPTSTTVGSTTTIDYTITVTNNSTSTTSTDVVASDTLPSALTFESATTTVGTSTYATSTDTETWTIGDLLPNASATLDIMALADTSASSTIANTATVSASTTDPDMSNNSSTILFFVQATSTPTSTPSADLSINKTVDNTSPSEGNTVNYTLTVTNNSTSTTSTDVVASDTLPTDLTFEDATASASTSFASSTGIWTIGDLSPSSTATLQIAALVNSGDAGNTITNTATVSASTTDPDLSNNSSSVSIDVQGGGCGSACGTPNVDLSIQKTEDVTSTFVGDPVNYTLLVTNLSSSTTSTDVVASDTLPSGLTFENATASASTSYASSTGIWTIGALAPNATATLTIATLVTGPGISIGGSTNSTITNTATVSESSSLNDPDMSNNSSSVSVLIGPALPPTDADLAIAKTVDNANPAAGDDVNYTIVVTNNGPATANFVDVEDALPVSLSIVSSTISQGSSTNAGVLDWNVGTLSPNATATLVLDAAVGGNQAGQSITNTATVTSTLSSLVDPDLSNNSSSVTINVQSAGCTSNCGGGGGGGGGGGNIPSAQIDIAKTVDNADPATGATIHYTLTVSAVGPSASFGVVASDTLPAGITFDSASSSEGSYNSSTGIWTIGTMNDGATATLVITATVTAPNGTTITNTGRVSESPTVISPLTGPMTSSVTINVGGNGGGGGGGGGGGQVLGASTSTGQVLGASCGLYLTSYIHPIRKNLNDPTEVDKLQTFLNQNLGLNIPITGYYGDQTIAAVNQFQVKYHIEVLKPWLPLGLSTEFTPTSYVYQTTQRWINLIMCPPLNLPVPALKVDNSGV